MKEYEKAIDEIISKLTQNQKEIAIQIAALRVYANHLETKLQNEINNGKERKNENI